MEKRLQASTPSAELLAGQHRPRRWGLVVGAATAAIGLIAGLGVIASAPASAEMVSSYYEFSPPVVAPGGTSRAAANCPGDEGDMATVNVTNPSMTTTAHAVQVGATNADVSVEASSDGVSDLIDTDIVGTWKIEIDCPSYDPWTDVLQVVPLSVEMSAWLDFNDDCSTVEPIESVVLGQQKYVCYMITNTTGQDITRVSMQSEGGTRFQYFEPGQFPHGSTITTADYSNQWLDPEGETLTDLWVWVEYGAKKSGTFGVSETRSIVVPPAAQGLELDVTAALDESDACPAEGGVSELTVDVGTDVWVCYQMTNNGAATFSEHTIEGLDVGTVADGITDPMAPGDVRTHKVKRTVTEATDLTATWSATWTGSSSGRTFTATGAGFIEVNEVVPPVEEEPTSTTTEDDGVAPIQGQDVGEDQGDEPGQLPASTTTTSTEVQAVVAQPKYAG